MVVLWKEDSGRQQSLLHLRTEEMRLALHNQQDLLSVMILLFFLVPRPRAPFEQPRGSYLEPQDPPEHTGFLPGLLRAHPPPAGGENKSGGSIVGAIATAITITRASSYSHFNE